MFCDSVFADLMDAGPVPGNHHFEADRSQIDADDVLPRYDESNGHSFKIFPMSLN